MENNCQIFAFSKMSQKLKIKFFDGENILMKNLFGVKKLCQGVGFLINVPSSSVLSVPLDKPLNLDCSFLCM
jgi:hypothetical protein